jgi:hypothetical protein
MGKKNISRCSPFKRDTTPETIFQYLGFKRKAPLSDFDQSKPKAIQEILKALGPGASFFTRRCPYKIRYKEIATKALRIENRKHTFLSSNTNGWVRRIKGSIREICERSLQVLPLDIGH